VADLGAQPCGCDGEICTDDVLVYQCPCCLRFVPWCFGAGDDMPDLCDDCWCCFEHDPAAPTAPQPPEGPTQRRDERDGGDKL
jgi:hypothetical protein